MALIVFLGFAVFYNKFRQERQSHRGSAVMPNPHQESIKGGKASEVLGGKIKGVG